MAIEARKQYLFGLVTGKSRDLAPRSRVVLRNRSVGYEEDNEFVGYAAERVSAVVRGSASVRRRTIEVTSSTIGDREIFRSRKRETLRRRDIKLSSDWSIFGIRTLISYRPEGRPRPKEGDKRVNRKGVEEVCEGVFDTDKISDALSWSEGVLTGSGANKFILGLSRRELVGSLVEEGKRQHYDLVLQVAESIPKMTTLKRGGIEWVDVWRDALGVRYARVHFKDPRAKTTRFKLSAYEPGGSAPVLRQ